MSPYEFEWDPAKADANRRKHGVTLDEASSVFVDPMAVIFADEWHSGSEYREIIIGWSGDGRMLLVSFTQRGARIVTWRPVG